MRFRTRVRSLLLLVALVAFALWCNSLMQRARESLFLFNYHSTASARLYSTGDWVDMRIAWRPCAEQDVRALIRQYNTSELTSRRELSTMLYRASDYHLKLALKYAEAWRRPWLPIVPDPPAPRLACPEVEPLNYLFKPGEL
jgi:hypothetical protein